jgi:urease accessory protein
MHREALNVRGNRPVLLTNCRRGEGVDSIVNLLEREVLFKT